MNAARRRIGVGNAIAPSSGEIPIAPPVFDVIEVKGELLIGDDRLRDCIRAIQDLRARCNQHEDFTTDPNYFIAANAQRNRRVAAILFRSNSLLVACLYLIEHCRLGVGLGLWRGGNPAGDGLVISPKQLRLHFVHMAMKILLRRRRIFGVSLSVKAELGACIELMGPKGKFRMFGEKSVERRLLLKDTYKETLSSLGPRTRRSLIGKRRQLENSARVRFIPRLEPAQALEAMLALCQKSKPERSTIFHHARYRLLSENPEFFSMALCLPSGQWLSLLTGWRRERITYVDYQMNDINYKKESISAVMRAFMLEHEIACKQDQIDFVGGTSLLLGRYCLALEPSTDIFLMRPGARAFLFGMVIPYLERESLYRSIRASSNSVNDPRG